MSASRDVGHKAIPYTPVLRGTSIAACRSATPHLGETAVLLTRLTRLALLPVLSTSLILAAPHSAAAQRRGSVRVVPVRRQVVVIGGYSAYPRWYYDSWSQWGPYPYPYPPFGYGYPMRDELTTAVKLEVTPRQAEVYVDGYQAGLVDDFDGLFQRLRLRPGAHEVVLFLDGYQTIRQKLYLNPGSDQKIHYAMEKLGAGQVSERPPQPDQEGPGQDPTQQPDGPGPSTRRPGPAGQRPPAGPPPSEGQRSFGTLTVRVQPGDADILIDGERWSAPAGQDRLAIELSEGRHHVEVRKAGFSTYTEDVLIRRGANLPLNVSLLRGAVQ
ncbi:MAG: PEGA domain-containing protein [Vicinamibacterales bacterium]